MPVIVDHFYNKKDQMGKLQLASCICVIGVDWFLLFIYLLVCPSQKQFQLRKLAVKGL